VTHDELIARWGAAPIGILGWRVRDRPMAAPVTPLLSAAGVPVVTSTLAYVRKMELLRADPRAGLLAGGVRIVGDTSVEVDRAGERFGGELLAQERAKFAPTAQIEAIPLHRRLLPWYFGRIIADVAPARVTEANESDAITLVTLDCDGYPTITPIPAVSPDQFDAVRIDLTPASPAGPPADGPALLLAHRESDDLSVLAQRTARGVVRAGVLEVERRAGSLDLKRVGTIGQLKDLWRLRGLAKQHRDRVTALDRS
jgi:hypothetical protein